MPSSDASAYRFSVGTATGTVWIDSVLETQWLGDAADPSLPAVIRAALLADVCAPLFVTLQAVTRQRVELLPPPAQPIPWLESATALHFALHNASTGSPALHGALVPDTPEAFAAFFAEPRCRPTALHRPYEFLPIPLVFKVGHTSLTAAELANVVAGDIIAIEHWRSHERNLLCVARLPAVPAWEIIARPSGNQLIVERIREMPLEPTRNDAPLATSSSPPSSETPHSLDGLAVDLHFELPSASIPFGELSTLQPGVIIELEQGISQSIIHLVANGMLIGTGHLIAVGQKLGVRVTTLTTPMPRKR
jgi:type III secretion protein Q